MLVPISSTRLQSCVGGSRSPTAAVVAGVGFRGPLGLARLLCHEPLVGGATLRAEVALLPR
eukprot:12906542-Prorocentrum_lima.AAC.1